MSFKCPFCPRRLATNQGLTLHISQTQTCRDRLNAFYDNLNAQLEQAGPSSMESDEDAQREGVDVNIDVEMGHNESSSPPDISADVPDDSAPSPSPQRGRRATVEDVPDEDEALKLPQDEVWIDNYDEERLAGATGEPCKTSFQFHRDQQKAAGLEPWSPFETEDEWELAQWLVSAGVSQKKIDALLKLKMVIRHLYCIQNSSETHPTKHVADSGSRT